MNLDECLLSRDVQGRVGAVKGEFKRKLRTKDAATSMKDILPNIVLMLAAVGT